MEQRCETCRFWVKHIDPRWGSPAPVVVTECRRHPPTLTGGGYTAWPTTAATDFCGDHESRLPLPVTKGE